MVTAYQIHQIPSVTVPAGQHLDRLAHLIPHPKHQPMLAGDLTRRHLVRLRRSPESGT